MENQENFNRDFKGVWIPKEVWLDDRLNALDKIILTEIDSLDQGEDGCFASNEYIANFCQCSATKVSTSINQLIKYGYLYVLKFDGRKRHLKSRLSNFERQDLKKCKADIKNLKDINTSNKTTNNIFNNSIDNKDNNTIPYEEIVNLYHEICVSYPRIIKLSESRKKTIKARYLEYGKVLSYFKVLFIKAEASNFLKGKNDNNWSASFDWLINPSNMIKVLEGNYDNKEEKKNESSSRPNNTNGSKYSQFS